MCELEFQLDFNSIIDVIVLRVTLHVNLFGGSLIAVSCLTIINLDRLMVLLLELS